MINLCIEVLEVLKWMVGCQTLGGATLRQQGSEA